MGEGDAMAEGAAPKIDLCHLCQVGSLGLLEYKGLSGEYAGIEERGVVRMRGWVCGGRGCSHNIIQSTCFETVSMRGQVYPQDKIYRFQETG